MVSTREWFQMKPPCTWVCPKKASRLEVAESLPGFNSGHHVFVFIERRAMQHLEAVQQNRPFGKAADIFDIRGRQVPLRPQRRGARYRVEPFQILLAGGDLVVIAPHHNGAMGAHPIHHEIGLGAVAHQVAAAERLVIAAGGFADHGLQRLPVAMKIAHDEIAHGKLDYAFLSRRTEISGGAPIRAGMPMVPMPRVTYAAERPARKSP